MKIRMGSKNKAYDSVLKAVYQATVIYLFQVTALYHLDLNSPTSSPTSSPSPSSSSPSSSSTSSTDDPISQLIKKECQHLYHYWRSPEIYDYPRHPIVTLVYLRKLKCYIKII